MSRESLRSHLLPLAVAAVMGAIIVGLLLFVVYMTFVPGLPTQGGSTLENWAALADRRLLTKVIPNTLAVGIGAIVLASTFAFPLAWLLMRTTLPLRSLFVTLLNLPAVIPSFVIAMGWIVLVDGRIGLLNNALRGVTGAPVDVSISGGPFGIAWVLGLVLAPAVFFLISGPIASIGASYDEAATVAGADMRRVMWRIDLPLILPSIFGALLYTFMTAVSIFDVPALLGGATEKVPVLATEVFYAVRPAGLSSSSLAYGAAGVYGLLIAAPSVVALYFYVRILGRAERYQVITGKGYRASDIDLGRYTPLAVAFVVLYLLLAVFLPLAVLAWISVLPIVQLPSAAALSKLTLVNYRDLFGQIGTTDVLGNTFTLILGVTLLTTVVSFAFSWIVVRTSLRVRGLFDVLAMLPHAIPSLAFAFALAMLGIVAARFVPWIPLAGTIGIIALCHLVIRIPFGTRVLNGALAQVHVELEEAARISGAETPKVMWAIVRPLVGVSLVFVALRTATLTAQEVTTALFLSGPRNQVFSVAVWNLWSGGSLGVASAGAFVMALLVAIVAFALLAASQRRAGSRRAVASEATAAAAAHA